MKDAVVKSGKDFNGKTLASNVSRGFGSLITNAWIDNNGGDSTTVKWVEFPFPGLTAALQRGTIDGYCAPEPFIDLGVKLASGSHSVVLYGEESGRRPGVSSKAAGSSPRISSRSTPTDLQRVQPA